MHVRQSKPRAVGERDGFLQCPAVPSVVAGHRATLPDDLDSGAPAPEDVLAVDEALARLAEKDERMAEVVKLRYFADLSVEETAEATGQSVRTVARLWTAARAWLARELGGAR